MNKSVLIVAPHADDETLGCGGTILRLIQEGYQVSWLLVTGMSEDSGYSVGQIHRRQQEIDKAAAAYQFANTYTLGLPPAQLDALPKGEVIGAVSGVIQSLKPEQIYCVYRNDAHSDHEVVFDAVMASTKSFRAPFVKRILAYETLSETDFGYKPEDPGFRPNVFVDISPFLEKKLEILAYFESEVGPFPFPRSTEALKALAKVRGIQCNAHAAEAFMLIKEIL
ncbi:PIG-L deacetylase family protein [Photobacterium rosenbergii]|uniref:PIG-L deacetylase family protein n=1 Tax=Photobacterium rosenbergii TaxID=294936 RepID=UPI001C99C921|nr:PIG-L deacetylase family protein [Photobacterium rosenbergii]MBY5947297.1 PIG-L family deacetylase [Photobacterium rosenbergii]